MEVAATDRLDGAESPVDNGRVSSSEVADPRQPPENALLGAECSGRTFLVFRDRDNKQQLFFFAPDSDSATVGRLQYSDLVIGWDAQVSRRHARFERHGNGWALVDDGMSSNGTFVNGARISGRRLLSDGDVVRFGNTTVIFRSPAPAAKLTAETPAAMQLSSTQRRALDALCEPCRAAPGASPATDEQIAEKLVVSVAEVRGHIKVICAKLGVGELPQTEARARLVERAFAEGLVSASRL